MQAARRWGWSECVKSSRSSFFFSFSRFETRKRRNEKRERVRRRGARWRRIMRKPRWMRRTTTHSTKIHPRNPERTRHACHRSTFNPQAPRGEASAVLERDTAIIALAAARQVVEEAERWLGVILPTRYAAGLAHRARVTYAHGASFRQNLRRSGDEGRDTFTRLCGTGWRRVCRRSDRSGLRGFHGIMCGAGWSCRKRPRAGCRA
jgi:hypothetical protein